MLVLSRRLSEEVVISRGEMKITCKIVDIRSAKVRMGFTAPDDVVIDREEVDQAKQRERIESAVHGRLST